MEKSESIKELATALNKAQATLQVAKKGSENPFFHSKYADLLAVWDACRGALTSNGLSVAQIADIDSEGKPVLETILMHTSGEWLKGRLPLMSAKQDPQGQGSAITYARRYSLSAIVGLCTEEDDDAEGAMDRGKGETKEPAQQSGHWCAIHQTPFFKKGKMKGYAHPVKDDFGEETEWCNEVKEEPKAPEPKVEGIKPNAPFNELEQITGLTSEIKTPAPTKVQNITELKALMAKHKVGTREAYEILSIGSFIELVDLDDAWKQIKEAKKI